MRLMWVPADGSDKREWTFRPNELMSVDSEDIELVGGGAWTSFDEFGRAFMAGNRRAWRAALWIVRRREDPGLQFHDLNLRVDEILVDLEDHEARIVRAEIESDRTMDPAQAGLLLGLLGEPADDPHAADGEDDADPLDRPSGSGDSATGGISPTTSTST